MTKHKNPIKLLERYLFYKESSCHEQKVMNLLHNNKKSNTQKYKNTYIIKKEFKKGTS